MSDLLVVDTIGEKLKESADQVVFFHKTVVNAIKNNQGPDAVTPELVMNLVGHCQSQYQLNLSAEFSGKMATAAALSGGNMRGAY